MPCSPTPRSPRPGSRAAPPADHGDFWDGRAGPDRRRGPHPVLRRYRTRPDHQRGKDRRTAATRAGLRQRPEQQALPWAIARQPLWGIGGWVAVLDDPDTAWAHARATFPAVPPTGRRHRHLADQADLARAEHPVINRAETVPAQRTLRRTDNGRARGHSHPRPATGQPRTQHARSGELAMIRLWMTHSGSGRSPAAAPRPE